MMDEKSVAFSNALVALFKGVINRETQSKQWGVLLAQRAQIEDYVAKIGLTVIVDENDGYAYLKQQTQVEEHAEIPRLIPRYALSYPVSLLLVLLRKQLLAFDAKNSVERFIVSKQELIETLRPYLKDTSNEAKQIKEIEANLNRIQEMGFIRTLDGDATQYEVLRILRGFVDAQWLSEMDARLQAYQTYAQGAQPEGSDNDESV
ncbi:MAG: DUF4194 domain-containing protein [Ruthenibacterium sp.]